MDDRWGRDPNVQVMRRVFARLETAQWKILDRLKISGQDMRLRHWRRETRALFDKAWAQAAGRGIPVSGERVTSLYLYCLVLRMAGDGVDVSDAVLPRDPEIEEIMREVMP